jgi:hypothetical protein
VQGAVVGIKHFKNVLRGLDNVFLKRCGAPTWSQLRTTNANRDR